jgi:hypothetical protein
LLCNTFETGTRVGGHRMRDTLQQWQIVGGIAVAPALFHRLPTAAQAGQPQPHIVDLAFLEVGHALDSARHRPVGVAFEGGRNEHRQPQSAGNRAGDPFIGGRHQGQGVALLAVLLDQVQGRGPDGRPDDLIHETRLQDRQLGRRALSPG